MSPGINSLILLCPEKLPGQHLRILDIRKFSRMEVYMCRSTCSLGPVCVTQQSHGCVSHSEVSLWSWLCLSRVITPFLCCPNKWPFPTYLGRSKFYKLIGLGAGYWTYHEMYIPMHIWSQQGAICPTVFCMVWCVMPLSQAPGVSPTGIIWYSAGGEHVPCRAMLLIGRYNDLDEIITHPSSKLCPDLATYFFCRSHCLWWVCFTTEVQTN